jgi:CBS domain-containing protein
MSRIAEVMSRAMVGVSPSARAEEAEAVALASGVQHLLVLEDDDLVGIATLETLHRARGGATVGDCMRAPVRTVSANASIDEAAEIMRRCEQSCLPVVAGGLILGLVTRERLIGARAKCLGPLPSA